jgi:hypothetical protein
MKIAIAIENSRSLKLRQIQLLLCIFNSTTTEREAFGPLPDLVMGLKEGLGAMRGV